MFKTQWTSTTFVNAAETQWMSTTSGNAAEWLLSGQLEHLGHL